MATSASELHKRRERCSRMLAEHYLWQMELEGYLAHGEDERQTSLIPTAEGASVLFMLELTRPEANEDVMSAETLGMAAQADEPKPRTIDVWREELRLDVPRLLSARHG